MNSRHDYHKTLESFCQNKSSIKIKVALLTFHNGKFSTWIEKLILLFEYLQLISQSLLLYESAQNFSQTSEKTFINGVFYFFKLVNPCYLLSYNEDQKLVTFCLTALICYTFLRVLLLGYVFLVALKGFKKISWLISLWQWIFKLQGRIAYFFIASFWTRLIVNNSESEDSYSLYGTGNSGNVGIGIIMITIEFLFSLTMETQFCFVLPSKSFLSSKNTVMQVATLVQKFLIHVLQMSFKSDFQVMLWINGVINFLFSLARHIYFYRTLSLYKLQALIAQGYLLGLVLAANIAGIFQSIVWASSYSDEDNADLIIVVWILLGILLAKLSRGVLHETMTKLFTGENEGSPELLLHKLCIFKEILKKAGIPGEHNDNYHFYCLLKWTIISNIKLIFSIKDPNLLNTEKLRENRLKIFTSFLEDLASKYPKNTMIKLFQAHIYAKDPALYIKTITIAAELQQKEGLNNYLTSTFLLYKIEKVILADYEKCPVKLDLLSYMENKITIEKLKKQILKIIENKITICSNILDNQCNIGTIFKSSQTIYQIKTETDKKIKTLISTLPDCYDSPFLLFAEYTFLVNYSLKESRKYKDIYTQRFNKHDKYFQSLALSEDNLYQDQNAFLILSGHRVSSGQIVYCSPSIETICGRDGVSYIDSHILSLFPPGLRAHYEEFFRQIFETGNKNLMNKTFKAFMYNKDKQIVEVEFFLRIHPYIKESLCLQMLIRPIPIQNEYLLLKEDGTIEAGTQKISEALDLETYPNPHVEQFSRELFKIHNAINVIQKTHYTQNGGQTPKIKLPIKQKESFASSSSSNSEDSSESLYEYKEALALYELYTSRGKKIQIHFSHNLTATYYCRASILPYKNTFMKLIYLQKPNQAEEAKTQQNQSKNVITLKDTTSKNNLGSGDASKLFPAADISNRKFSIFGEIMPLNFRFPSNLAKDSVGTESEVDLEPHTLTGNMEDCTEREPDDEPLDSLVSRNQPLMSTERKLITSPTSERNDTFSPKPLLLKKKSLFAKAAKTTSRSQDESIDTDLLTNLENNHSDHKVRHSSTVIDNNKQENQAVKDFEKGEYKTLKGILRNKSYPKSFTLLCVGFYGVIALTLISQILLKTNSDNTMQDLVLKKNLLKNAEFFSFKAQQIQMNSVTGLLELRGVFEHSATAPGLNTSLKNFVERVSSLEKARLAIIQELDYLNDGYQESLAEKDVRIYGSFYASSKDYYRNLTIFQASEVIENAVHYLLAMDSVINSAGWEDFYFLFENVLDDFLIKCKEITSYFVKSVKDQKAYFQSVVSLCLVVTPFTLLGIILVLVFIIWRQYNIEKNYLLTFIKLKPKEVKDIQTSLLNFKRAIMSEEMLAKKHYLKNFVNMTLHTHHEKGQSEYQSNKNQVIVYSSFRKRYYNYVIRVVLYLSSLIGIMIWNYIATDNSTHHIYSKQNQLEYANYISQRVCVSYAAYGALYVSNNTLNVEGQSSLSSLTQATAEIVEIIKEIPKVFLNIDGTYDPEVKTLIYGDYNCDGLTDNPLYYCQVLIGMGQQINMLPQIAAYSTNIQNKITDYNNADKSSFDTIITAAFVNMGTFLPQYSLIVGISQLISDLVDARLSDYIKAANQIRSIILIIFSMCLILASVLIWFDVFIQLREVDNDFKKVLQTLPLRLVLSSFLLKVFLKKTS